MLTADFINHRPDDPRYNRSAGLQDMVVWQFRVTFLPERVLLSKYDLLPPSIPEELAEDFSWWADVQPLAGFEAQIDLILPKMDSWSTSRRMWGREDKDDAHVLYVDESKSKVEEIAFRIDANAISPELVRQICILARQLECVLLTPDYEILLADESMVLAAIQHSTARAFVDDPVATLLKLGEPEMQKRFNRPITDMKEKASGSIFSKVDPFPQVEIVDFIRLMQDFVAKRIDVQLYRRSYFDLFKMRIGGMSDDEDKIIQQGYGDADDFDDVVRLEFTIDEAQLRERVSASLEKLRVLGHAIPNS